jgi:PfaD family protein
MRHWHSSKTIGSWHPGASSVEPLESGIQNALLNVAQPIYVVNQDGRIFVSQDGAAELGSVAWRSDGLPLVAHVPPLDPAALGDALFKSTYVVRYAYVAGEMANAISSVRMLKEVGRSGMIGFFGAGGLIPSEVAEAIDQLQSTEPPIPFGVNLIHSPGNLELEMALAELFIAKRVRLASASAYVEPTLPLTYFRIKGVFRDAEGRISCPNKIIGKVSRVEVARKFLSPPPPRHISRLIDLKLISPEEASLAPFVPLVEDLTAEADSGGHTDNRPAITLLPTMIALRDELSRVHAYAKPPCIGLAGGIATPQATAAAFAMGAGYVLTGSINQCCVEAGTSEAVCRMLAEAGQADVIMAPSADMFELGVKVQVLKRGTMFPQRAAKLYELYSLYDSCDQIPAQQRDLLERDVFRCSLEDAWKQTRRFFMERDPKQIDLAQKKPKHKMALIFRSYIGQAATWAIRGEPSRKIDYQIWCGPAMGAFNQWAKGSFLEKTQNRRAVSVAMNLMFGAAVATRCAWLRSQGVFVPAGAGTIRPMEVAEIRQRIGEPPHFS